MEDSKRDKLQKQSLLIDDCPKGLKIVLEKRAILAKRLLDSGPMSRSNEEVVNETIEMFNETIKKYFSI